MDNLQKLTLFLRPPGKGVFTVSTGSDLASSLWQTIYKTSDEKNVLSQWQKKLQNISQTKIILLGVPSDCGAGILRGANMGPLYLRQALYKKSFFQKLLKTKSLLDIGDIFVVPQLLSDDMLSDPQKEKNQHYLYPNIQDKTLPVSPLSILKETLHSLFSINPKAKILTLGGDHSISWPIVQVYAKKMTFCILHIDAHTDLLKSRLGIDHCFGTWAYHANDLIGRKQRLVQIGIRRSGNDKEYWEKTCDVKQFWAPEILKNEKQTLSNIIQHLKSLKLTKVYISNDIDGTGMEYAAATGTPEIKGLTPAFVSKLIQEIGKEFEVVGSDLVEVAPVLNLNCKGEPQKTLNVACQYIEKTLKALLTRP